MASRQASPMTALLFPFSGRGLVAGAVEPPAEKRAVLDGPIRRLRRRDHDERGRMIENVEFGIVQNVAKWMRGRGEGRLEQMRLGLIRNMCKQPQVLHHETTQGC